MTTERTRRFRIWTASLKGKRTRFFEFSLWIRARWRDFANKLNLRYDGGDINGPIVPDTASKAVFMHLGHDKGQAAFDEWLEAKYGILTNEEAEAVTIFPEY